MKNLTFYLLCFISLVILNGVFAFQEWWEKSKVIFYIFKKYYLQVLNLDTENFSQLVGKDKFVVVKFYTKWCKYCKILSPAYDKFYKHMKKQNKNLIVARIEGEENSDICQQYGISSFPKVVLFYPHSLEIQSIFSGPRTLENLIEWVDEHTVNNSEEFLNTSLEVLEDEGNNETEITNDINHAGFEKKFKEKTNLPLIDDNQHIKNITELIVAKKYNRRRTYNETLVKLFNETKTKYEILYQDFLSIKTKLKKQNQSDLELIIDENFNSGDDTSFELFDLMVFSLVGFILVSCFFVGRKIYNKII